ncbi:MAG: FAD-binding oxidoreductase [Thiolinea sp.]
MNQHISALTEILDARSVLSGDAIEARYHVDWGGENACAPALVIRPEDSTALSKALSYCDTNGLAVVTQGGMTGLSSGATPLAGEVALSLERLNGITELDQQGMTMTVKAGTPLQVIQQAAADIGLRFPLDLGARGSCHIGGNVATNAGGNQVVRFGSARALVLGMEAVLANGTVMRSMNKMIKNNAGYDLKHLFIGSEGTLGVITELVLRLYPASKTQQTALCALPDFESTTAFLQGIMAELPGVTSFEVMWQKYVNAICEVSEPAQQPFDQQHAIYVLLEAEGCTPDQFQQALFDFMETGLISDALIAASGKDSDAFWAIRDGVADLMAGLNGFATFDVGLPISRMKDFIIATDQALQTRFADVNNLPLGHIADGNLHFITWTGNPADVQAIYDTVYEVVHQFNGTVTAEHGVGISKRKYLSLCRSEEELTLMRTLKTTFDPNGILNPGRIFE